MIESGERMKDKMQNGLDLQDKHLGRESLSEQQDRRHLIPTETYPKTYHSETLMECCKAVRCLMLASVVDHQGKYTMNGITMDLYHLHIWEDSHHPAHLVACPDTVEERCRREQDQASLLAI